MKIYLTLLGLVLSLPLVAANKKPLTKEESAKVIEAAIWYAILLDCIGANIVAWFCNDWYREKFKTLHKHFPATKG